MSYSFPPDVGQRIHSQLERGCFQSEDDVLRAAIAALERESEDLAAIQAGIDDIAAGRFRPLQRSMLSFGRLTKLRTRHELPGCIDGPRSC